MDEKNNENRIVINVEVYRLGSIESIEEFKEFNLNENGDIYLGAKQPKSREYFTECNDALMKGLSFIPVGGANPPLQLVNISPMKHDLLQNLKKIASENKHF